MDPTKTRIWNADQLGLPARKREAGTAVRVRRSSSVPPPPPPPRRARASAPPPAPSTLTARWSANGDARGPLASTRIMPIELLMPSALPAPPPPLAARIVVEPSRFRLLKRIAGHLLLATLTVLAVAVWKLPLRQYVRARSLPPSAAAPATTQAHGDIRVADAAPQIALKTSEESAPTARAARRQVRVVSLQRKAVELVISGDFIGAEQAYRALASEQPEVDAYREATRILAARRPK